MIVMEYEDKSKDLAKFVSWLVENEHDWVHKFKMGLRIEIRKQVVLYELTTYTNMINKALIIEMKVNKKLAYSERN